MAQAAGVDMVVTGDRAVDRSRAVRQVTAGRAIPLGGLGGCR